MAENKLPLTEQEQAEIEKKANQLLEEKDSESRTRTYKGWFGKIITAGLCGWTMFQLYYNTLGAMSAINLRAFHCMFLLVFTFLLYPITKRENTSESCRISSIWCLSLSRSDALAI